MDKFYDQKYNHFIDESLVVNTDFFNEMKNDILCCICDGIVCDAVMCKGCESPFCKKCITLWKKRSGSCPSRCEPPFILVNPSRALKSIIDKIKLQCFNGCCVNLTYFNEHRINCQELMYDDPVIGLNVLNDKNMYDNNSASQQTALVNNNSLIQNSDSKSRLDKFRNRLSKAGLTYNDTKLKDNIIVLEGLKPTKRVNAIYSVFLHNTVPIIFFGTENDIFQSCNNGINTTTKRIKTNYVGSHEISVLCFTSIQEFLFSGGGDKEIGIWQVGFKKTELITKFSAHEKPVTCLASSEDEMYIVSGSADKTIKVWSFDKNSKELILINSIEAHLNFITSVCFITLMNENYIATGGSDKQINIFHVNQTDKAPFRRFNGQSWITALVSFEDKGSSLLVSSGEDLSIRLWDPLDFETNEEQSVYYYHDKGISSLTKFFSSQTLKTYIVSAGLDNNILVWNLTHTEPIKIITNDVVKKEQVTCVAACEILGCQYIISGDIQGGIKLHEVSQLS